LKNGGEVTTATYGTGHAGEIYLESNNLFMNSASINSHSQPYTINNETATSNAGDINIKTKNKVELFDSVISTKWPVPYVAVVTSPPFFK